MKSSILAGLALCALASPALANPLEARDGKTKTITKTETETDIVTRYKTRTTTETETIKKVRTETQTVIRSTTVTINRPTTVVKSKTVTVQGPTSTKTLPASTKTLPASTVTLPASRLPASTVTLPASTKTMQASTVTLSASTRTIPASTVTLPASTKTMPPSTMWMPASTVTLPASVKTLPASTMTLPASTVTAPPKTVVTTIPGPTITDVSIATVSVTAYQTSYIGNGTAVTFSKTITSYLTSACASLGAASSSLASPSTSSSSAAAAAASTAVTYGNVITNTQCSNPKAYYIRVDGTGTSIDGTVMLNYDKTGTRQYAYFLGPTTAQALGNKAPQPFIYNSDGSFSSYAWNTNEALRVYPQGGGDTRAGFIVSDQYGEKLTCGLQGSTLVNCGSDFTGTFLAGLMVGPNRIPVVAGGYYYYNDAQYRNGTYTLVPACGI